jgi:Gram-negative bacterial TonB protein C-terminal
MFMSIRAILKYGDCLRKMPTAWYAFIDMRLPGYALLVLASTLAGFGQAGPDAAPGLPKDPNELLAVAAPSYDFTSPSLKPWHLKASYQLYDETGAPAEQGTFEYWWASPHIYRTTWIRGASVHSSWHTGEGKHAFQASGNPMEYFEYKLRSDLLSPLPSKDDLNPAETRLQMESISLGDAKVACVMLDPLMTQPGKIAGVPLGLFPTFCFDPKQPILRISYSLGTVTTEFNKIVKVQGKCLAREITLFEGKRKILSATVDAINGITDTDTALTPPSGLAVISDKPVDVPESVAHAQLLKKGNLVYPKDALQARIEGTVVLKATIGIDGGMHELHVVSAPWPSMAVAALTAASQIEYKPFILNGLPVEINTTIKMVFRLSR